MDHEVAHAPELDQIESADCGERLVLATDRLMRTLRSISMPRKPGRAAAPGGGEMRRWC